MTHTPQQVAPGRYAGLDGLRAIAVILVIVYHLFPQWGIAQGFLGVDVFFVISGFLITSLMLREIGAHGKVRLGGFWQRRARRLLPALLTLLAVCGLWAGVVGGDVLVGLGLQILGALTFSFNWVSIVIGTGYFADASPELFRNLWSLAVEEQFYVIWPLLLPLLLLIPRRTVRVGVTLTAALASAAWMGVLVIHGTDVTRAYFGTDSHGFGILIGVALAFAVQQGLPGWMRSSRMRTITATAGTIAAFGIVGIALLPDSFGAATFPGALLGASVLTAVVIFACLPPGSRLGAALDVAPLRWVGVRSYGLYLWHWPVAVLIVAATTGIDMEKSIPLPLGVLALAVTVIAAEASFRFIEQPVRRLGFRGAAAQLRRGITAKPAQRFATVAVIAAAAIAVGGTVHAVVSAPQTTTAEQVVAQGAAALEAARRHSPPPAEPPPLDTPSSGLPGTLVAAEPAPSASAEPDHSDAPAPVGGDQITAVGDSVMLASAPGLLTQLPGIQIDAAVSRSIWAAPGILEDLAAHDQLRPYVAVALGTNGPVEVEVLQRITEIIGPDRMLILVNASAPRDWIPEVNATLADFATRSPHIVVADWSGAIAPHPDQLAGDLIHPNELGGTTYAETLAGAVQQVEAARITEQQRIIRDHALAEAQRTRLRMLID